MAKENFEKHILPDGDVVTLWRTHPGRVGEPLQVVDEDGEVVERVSLTVPNQAHTIDEIVEKFTRSGVEIPQRDLVFLGDVEVEDMQFMSRIDQLVYAAELRREIAKNKKLIEDAEKAEAERKPKPVKKEEKISPSDVVPGPGAKDDIEGV